MRFNFKDHVHDERRVNGQTLHAIDQSGMPCFRSKNLGEEVRRAVGRRRVLRKLLGRRHLHCEFDALFQAIEAAQVLPGDRQGIEGGECGNPRA